jgi:hypothetical protein
MNLPFKEVWLVDFEFQSPDGERPTPWCVCALELNSGRRIRQWLGDGAPATPPYPTAAESLFIAYYASAELGCHLALQWELPVRVLDLCVEFKNLTSGLKPAAGKGLLGALSFFGIDGLAVVEKDSMRKLAIEGGPFTDGDKDALLTYCMSDVDALAKLLPAMLPHISLPHGLIRGRYMCAVAHMERTGVPIDVEMLERLRTHWPAIKNRLIVEVDRDYQVYLPTGQKYLDPHCPGDAAILNTAAQFAVDPYALAQVAKDAWNEERDSTRDLLRARHVARKRTGLTAKRIRRHEDSGKDYTTFFGLDVAARELAGEYPELGIGAGYAGDDETDRSGELWDKLSKPDVTKSRETILRECAERLSASTCPDQELHLGPLSFSMSRFKEFLCRNSLPWPVIDSGVPDLSDDCFREMAKAFPQVSKLRELRHALSQLRLNDLSVGADGRNRCMLSAFGSRTGRNQPSNSRFIFGPSTWLRSLIKPGPGQAVAYIDYSQQELAVASYLSHDTAMQSAYRSGDFYLSLAQLSGKAPSDATKETHNSIRDQFKTVSLGVLYGLSIWGLSRKLGVPFRYGRELLELHQDRFSTFWQWSDRIEMTGMLLNKLTTNFGWSVHVGQDANPRSLRNFRMQAGGAEMTQLACCLCTERNIKVCAPIHDAILIEAPDTDIDDTVTRAQAAMTEASEIVLPGFPLRTEAVIVRYPDRYVDKRGKEFWDLVCRELEAVEAKRRSVSEQLEDQFLTH